MCDSVTVTPLDPLASATTVSFVEHCVDRDGVERRCDGLVERTREDRRLDQQIPVVTNASIVASIGSIIPAPLAMPPIEKVLSAVFT